MATFTINSDLLPTTSEDTLLLDVSEASGNVGFSIATYGSSNTLPTIDWGDGTVEDIVVREQTHTYNSQYTGVITIVVPGGLGRVKSISRLLNVNIPFSFNLSRLSDTINLERIGLLLPVNTITGDINSIGSTRLAAIEVSGQNTISGDIGSKVYSRVTSFRIIGENTLRGDLSNTFEIIKTLDIQGQNTVSGNLNKISQTVESLGIGGENTISGTYNNLNSKVNTFRVQGQNTLTGNISSFSNKSNFSAFELAGNGIITGDFSDATTLPLLELQINTPNSNITGDLSDLPEKIVLRLLQGTNPITGDIADGDGRGITIVGNNTITGDLFNYKKDLFGNFTLKYTSSNTLIYSNTGKNWNGFLDLEVSNNHQNSFTSQMMDNMLIDMNNSSFRRDKSRVIFTGGFSRTSNSDSAVTQLENDGVTVTVL